MSMYVALQGSSNDRSYLIGWSSAHALIVVRDKPSGSIQSSEWALIRTISPPSRYHPSRRKGSKVVVHPFPCSYSLHGERRERRWSGSLHYSLQVSPISSNPSLYNRSKIEEYNPSRMQVISITWTKKVSSSIKLIQLKSIQLTCMLHLRQKKQASLGKATTS